jgi:phosphonate transport system substrate-binding protein
MKKSFYLLLVIVMALPAMLLVPTTGAQEPVGSEANPIQVYFVPSVEVQTIIEGGDALAALLKDATGLNYEVYVPTSYAATIEAMCAAPDKSMGFIPAAGYVIASNHCGVQVSAKAVRFGWAVYWAQYIVRRDSDIYDLGDLDGKSWGYGDTSSTSGYIVPATELMAKGITPSKEVQTGGHNQTVLAVYNGEVDFGTTYYSPPVMPGAPWQIGDLPEPFDLSVDQSYIGDDGELYVGPVQVWDARRAVRETAPDVVDKVRILAISAPIPNDTMSFGPDFPEDVKQQIVDALFALAGDQEKWNTTALYTSYDWTGIQPATDAEFDGVRQWFNVLGLTEEDIFGGG